MTLLTKPLISMPAFPHSAGSHGKAGRGLSVLVTTAPQGGWHIPDTQKTSNE